MLGNGDSDFPSVSFLKILFNGSVLFLFLVQVIFLLVCFVTSVSSSGQFYRLYPF